MKRNFKNHVLLVRCYRNDVTGALGWQRRYIPSIEKAKDALALYTRSHMGTLYCCLFSPVDKRGVRRQLKRYLYSNMWPVSKAAQMRAGLRVIIDPRFAKPEYRRTTG